MKSLTGFVVLVLPVAALALLADPAAARPSRRDAVHRAYSHADARGLEGCRVDTIVDVNAGGAVRVHLVCPPNSVVVVIGDDRRNDQVIVRPRPVPPPAPLPPAPPRDTIVIIEDDDDDSDSDSDKKHKHKKHKHKHKHGHHDDSDSDSDSR